MQIDKPTLIDAICGTKYTIDDMVMFSKTGIAKFTGNQHNPDWQFIRTELEKLNISQLAIIYGLHD